MTKRYTLGELVDYAFRNRKEKAFVGWSRDNIHCALLESLQDGTLLYSVDSNGQINGVVHAQRFDKEKVLFVGNLLATQHGVLNEFIRRFKMLFVGYRLEADRRGKRKIYRTERLVNLLTKD